jgi:hypothetical protein
MNTVEYLKMDHINHLKEKKRPHLKMLDVPFPNIQTFLSMSQAAHGQNSKFSISKSNVTILCTCMQYNTLYNAISFPPLNTLYNPSSFPSSVHSL